MKFENDEFPSLTQQSKFLYTIFLAFLLCLLYVMFFRR